MERIENCIVFLLGKAYQHANQETKQRLAPHGVTPAQYGLLEVLWERDDQSGTELGARLLLDSATITGLLDRLERAALVVRRPDPHDRRINRIVLTDQGRSLRAPLSRAMDEVEAAVLDRFSDEERARLRAMLSDLGRVAVPTGSTPSKGGRG